MNGEEPLNKVHSQEEYRTGPKDVFILGDGIKGHDNQSAGIAWWLKELAGSSIAEIATPRLSGYERFLSLKLMVRSIRSGNRKACSRWLEGAGGDPILEAVRENMRRVGSKAGEVLFLSAGSSAAPFSLALAKITGARCACIMTPSVLGTEPFDFAIVPEHDHPVPASNLFVTLGAPNMIRPGLLDAEASVLADRFPRGSSERWALLLGGDDANYRLTPGWARRWIPPLLEEAERVGAVVYTTTSRRTSPETEREIVEITGDRSAVHAIILASRENWNPVPGMLGLCQRVFCTEDSVSMISEAATAGHTVSVIAVERRNGFKGVLQDITERLAGGGIIPKRFLWGTPRFDEMIHGFYKRGLAVIVSSDPNNVASSVIRKDGRQGDSFNEARRAAEWIIKRWSS